MRRILIKIGGRAFEESDSLGALARAIKAHQQFDFILVHGGGAEISAALNAANRGTRFIDGVRVTEKEDLDIVESVLSGTVNKRIAGVFERNGLVPVRLSGKTGRLLVTEPFSKNGRYYGLVGQVKKVNPGVVLSALTKKQVPVVSPISADDNGLGYNVNADSAAAALAVGAACTDLVYFTDVPGVQIENRFLPQLNEPTARTLIQEGTIHGGMVAKIESVLQVLHKGVERVFIARWADQEEFSNLLDGKPASGTVVVK